MEEVREGKQAANIRTVQRSVGTIVAGARTVAGESRTRSWPCRVTAADYDNAG